MIAHGGVKEILSLTSTTMRVKGSSYKGTYLTCLVLAPNNGQYLTTDIRRITKNTSLRRCQGDLSLTSTAMEVKESSYKDTRLSIGRDLTTDGT